MLGLKMYVILSELQMNLDRRCQLSLALACQPHNCSYHMIICCIEGLPEMQRKQALQTHQNADLEDSCFWYLSVVLIRA
jgi:hypothetical protein